MSFLYAPFDQSSVVHIREVTFAFGTVEIEMIVFEAVTKWRVVLQPLKCEDNVSKCVPSIAKSGESRRYLRTKRCYYS